MLQVKEHFVLAIAVDVHVDVQESGNYYEKRNRDPQNQGLRKLVPYVCLDEQGTRVESSRVHLE